MKTAEASQLRCKGYRTKIFVGRDAFEGKQPLTSEDIRYLIVADGGRHAERYTKGSSYLSNEEITRGMTNGTLSAHVLYGLDDVDALGQGIRRMVSGEFQMSTFQSNETRFLYMIGGYTLNQVNKTGSDLERKAINKLRQEHSLIPELRNMQIPRSHIELRKDKFK